MNVLTNVDERILRTTIYYLKIVGGVTTAGVTKLENSMCEVCCL